VSAKKLGLLDAVERDPFVGTAARLTVIPSLAG
jgi:hypothetical protein